MQLEACIRWMDICLGIYSI